VQDQTEHAAARRNLDAQIADLTRSVEIERVAIQQVRAQNIAPLVDDTQVRPIYSAARAGEQPGRRGRDLVGYVAKALCDIPSMTERVDNLAVELAPEFSASSPWRRRRARVPRLRAHRSPRAGASWRSHRSRAATMPAAGNSNAT
jgi:hypothetical protein